MKQKTIMGDTAPTQEELIVQYREQIKTLKYKNSKLEEQNKLLKKIIHVDRERVIDFELELLKLHDIYKDFNEKIKELIKN